jgi:LL-diaminopimelate aminotransferase
MSEPYFQQQFADRIGGALYGKGTEIYKFEKIKRAKRLALKEHPERHLLDFGIGENDQMADERVRAALKIECDKIENRGYADNGIIEYKQAAARFMEREFGVSLNPESEINHCIGTKSALAMLPAAFINPGDITLMTTPGYPVAGTHTKYYGGSVHQLPLVRERDFYPDLDGIPKSVLERAKILVLNYPNSPTGKRASVSFYQRAIEFAHQNRIVIVQDAAHIMLSYGEKPLSFLQVPGARDVGVELHSMSKGFDMIGWRLGFVAGNPLLVRAFSDVKDNCDSGQFMAIQKAGAVALDNPQLPTQVRTRYERRLKKLVSALQSIGCNVEMPGGTYFLYVAAPKGIAGGRSFASAEESAHFLITERSVCTVPWDDAGAFLRFSTTYQAATEQDEDQLMTELVDRLRSSNLVWS